MSDSLRHRALVPTEMPRDLPLPTYRFQQDSRPVPVAPDSVHDAAAILKGYNFMGCAATKPLKG